MAGMQRHREAAPHIRRLDKLMVGQQIPARFILSMARNTNWVLNFSSELVNGNLFMTALPDSSHHGTFPA